MKALAPVLLALTIAAAAAGCGDVAASEPVNAPAETVELAAAATPIATPAPATTPSGLEIAGDLKPSLAAELSFKVGGQLGSVRVSRNDLVKQGQVIATLSDAEAKAQLAAAEAAVAAAEAQAAIAEDQAKRVTELAEGNAAPVAQATAAKHQAAAAAAVAQQARAARDLARVNADNHVIKAPFTGVIVRVKDATGETMGPGMPVARLERLDTLVLHGTISEKELDLVKAGDEVVVKTSSGREAPGRVKSVVRSLDGMSRRAPVEIEVSNKDGSLAAGAYVRAELRKTVAKN